MIILYTTQGNYADAMRVGIDGMRMLGIRLPEKVSDVRVGLELLKLRFRFGRRKIEDLIDMQYTAMPENMEEAKQLASDYLARHPSKSIDHPEITLWDMLSYAYLAINTGTVAFYANPNLFLSRSTASTGCWTMKSILNTPLCLYRHGDRLSDRRWAFISMDTGWVWAALKTNEKDRGYQEPMQDRIRFSDVYPALEETCAI